MKFKPFISSRHLVQYEMCSQQILVDENSSNNCLKFIYTMLVIASLQHSLDYHEAQHQYKQLYDKANRADGWMDIMIL